MVKRQEVLQKLVDLIPEMYRIIHDFGPLMAGICLEISKGRKTLSVHGVDPHKFDNQWIVSLGDGIESKIWFSSPGAVPISWDARLGSKGLPSRDYCVRADPPWNLGSSSPTRAIAQEYSTLSGEEILRINLVELGNRCVFFIWTQSSKLQTVLKLTQQSGMRLRAI